MAVHIPVCAVDQALWRVELVHLDRVLDRAAKEVLVLFGWRHAGDFVERVLLSRFAEAWYWPSFRAHEVHKWTSKIDFRQRSSLRSTITFIA